MHFWNIKKLQLCSEIFDNFVSGQQRMSEHEYYFNLNCYLLHVTYLSSSVCKHELYNALLLFMNTNCMLNTFCEHENYSILIVNVNTTLHFLWTWALLCTSCEHELYSALPVNMNPTLHSLWTWTLLCIVCELLGGTTQALTSHWDVWFPLKSILVSG